jgi:GTP cyclohydrolase II
MTTGVGAPRPDADWIELADGVQVDITRTILPLEHYGSPEIVSFRGLPGGDGKDHFALIFPSRQADAKIPLVRMHSECVTGDVLGSLRCDCGKQLTEALSRLSIEGGILIYLRQEGRGIGLDEKLRAYQLQDSGFDTFEANVRLGHGEDARSYVLAAEILRVLDVPKIRLLTRNPDKARQLRSAGIDVVEQVKTGLHLNPRNEKYLQAKERRAARAAGSDRKR